jgi:hypothetical protein
VLFLEPEDIQSVLEAAYGTPLTPCSPKASKQAYIRFAHFLSSAHAAVAKLYGPSYVYIMPDTAGRYGPFKLLLTDSMMRVATGGLVLQIAPIQDTFTEKRWRILYANRFPLSPNPAPNAPFAYDTVITLAQGIALAKQQPNAPCSSAISGASLIQSMLQLNFEGASGPINFTQNYVTQREYALLNLDGLTFNMVCAAS